MMDEIEIKRILERYKAGNASEADIALLESWYLTDGEQQGVRVLSMEERVHAVDTVWNNLEKNYLQDSAGNESGDQRDQFSGQGNEPHRRPDQPNLQHNKPHGFQHEEITRSGRRLYSWPRIAAAAAILALLSFGGYFLIRNTNQNALVVSAKNDIAPGKNSATLTLANGKQIVLNNAVNGQLASESGITISKSAQGELIYKADPANENTVNAGQLNTLETFKGEQYQVILPDGSHVWLNAASILKYPVAFSRKERLVELTGEGYFEVAHQKSRPFRVKTAQQIVEVLGTHFNINAYPDEPVSRTTLLEGSVRITTSALERSAAGSLMLKPGEQSVLIGNQVNIVEANLEETIAWKNGYFMFESEKITAVMRKIARWYNVEVVYEGEVPTDQFGGTVSRFEKVSQVLKKLELTDKVHFKVEGRRIIVTK